ncbi:hypothetical protein BE20_58120 [Sorangium cellulosum]|nr:hypothetical protein BE20_58120 [Sorangium cellulosum]
MIQYLRSTAIADLYAASDDGEPPPAGSVTRWFLLPEGASAPATLDLSQTWALAGTYIFLETPLPAGGEAVFAAAAWAFLDDAAFWTPRVAWFPSGTPSGGALDGYVLSTSPIDPSVTGRALVVSYRNYALVVGVGTPLGLDTAAQALTLSQTAARPIALTTEFGGAALRGAGSVSIPLTGADAGSLQFPLSLGATGGVSDLTHLDVGLRAYYATPGTSTDGGVSTLVTSLAYPVFDPGQTPTLGASLAPFSAAEGRSYFTFAAGGGALRSCYATVTGYRALLTPYADGAGPSGAPARLVFASRPSALPPSPEDLYTLVPKGDFALSTERPAGGTRADEAVPAVAVTSPNSRLMCGLSGVEYVGLGAGANALSFFTGSPAYARGFNPASSVQAATTLTTDATTAWALPTEPGAAPLTYYAQPDGAVLHQPSSSGAAFDPLVYLEVAANALPAAATAAAAAPIFPYAGVSAGDPDLDAYLALEAKVLSPNRRAIVAREGGPPPASAAHPAFARAAAPEAGFAGVTPQGLLAIFADTTLQTMDELVLAQMPDGSRFSLRHLPNGAALRTAIASNQLFLVASNTAAIGPHLSADPSQNRIRIEGWTFDLDPSTWVTTGPPALQGTTLIFKFADGQLVDLVKDTGAWAKAGASAAPFNVDDEATSTRVGLLIQRAIDAYDGGKGIAEFATFVAAVTDAAWRGILILNAETPLEALPDACKGLAAGIDPALFHAHHVGINTAKIASTSPISIEASSMFALIRYEAPRVPITPNGAAYQFQVDLLEVLFENSAIASFSSTIELLVAELFGDVVDLPAADRILCLYGVLQRQTIAGKIYDTYLFQTAQNHPRAFPLAEGSVFRQIQIGSAQLVTQLDSGDGLTHTYFALAGLLDFAALEGLDVFSFGGQGASDVAGLAYSKLLVRMTFDPAVQNSSVFAFDATGIAFDPSSSTARPDSLYLHFPIKVSAFIQADSVSSPGGMGYLGVQSPLTQSALVYPWFGLVFDLDLGSPGALAAKVGFTAQLLAAWSPSSGAYKVFIGLKLPGSDGGKGTISVEGVLSLGFRAIVLGKDGPSTYYLLLNALTLKFLGLKFPPGGQIDMALFGNPTEEHDSSLGWYAAYAKDQAQTPSGAKAARALPRRRAS